MTTSAESMYTKIKSRIKYLYRLDPESSSFQNISSWCANRIAWSYKFKRITYNEMVELSTEITNIQEGNY